MKDNVYLIKRINEMRKEEHELQKQIILCKKYKSGELFGDVNNNAHRTGQVKELELMDLTIQKYQQELEQAQIQNQELRMRRPPRNLAPLQDGQVDMDGNNVYDEGMQQMDDGAY